MKIRHCDVCNVDIGYKNWSRHIDSKKHKKNEGNNLVTFSNTTSNNLVTFSNNLVTSSNNLVTQDKNQYQCEYCNKIFNKSNSYYRHKKHSCKVKKKEDEQKEFIKQQIINNTTNNNTNTNTNSHNTMNVTNNNTININNYGNEDYSALDKEFLLKLSLEPNNSKRKMITMLDQVYLKNEDNYNVIVSSKDGNHCKILNENKEWKTENIDKVLDYRMYKTVLEVIQSVNRYTKELGPETYDKTMNGINKYQKLIQYKKDDKLNKEDKKDFKEIREDHKLKLYNLNKK